MNRVWHIYWAFVLAAIWDFSLTIWNLSTLGFSFEGNPFIRNWWIAILVKLIACLIFIPQTVNYDKKTFFQQTAFIGTMLLLIAGQIYGGLSHLPLLIKQHESTNTILTNDTVIFTINNELITYSIPKDMLTRSVWYLKILGVLLVWPYIYMLLSIWLTLWTTKKKVI